MVRKITAQEQPMDGADLVNYEGAPAFSRTPEERYINMLMTNTMSNTFYVKERDMIEGSLDLHQEMLARGDFEFIARALVYARQHGMMRLQPIVGVFLFSKSYPAHVGNLFTAAFNGVIRTPQDLKDFMELAYARAGTIRGYAPRGMGRRTRRVIEDWLNKRMTAYWAIKYGGAARGWTLRDVLRVIHPVPDTDMAESLFKYIVSGEVDFATIPDEDQRITIESYEDLKSEGPERTPQFNIQHGGLPHEVVTVHIGKDLKAWKALTIQMPIFAMVRNLVAMRSIGVLNDPELLEFVAGKLMNENVIGHSRMLPFRFFDALDAYSAAAVKGRYTEDYHIDSMLVNALNRAAELSFVNMPELLGRVVIAPDVSSSMSGFEQKIAGIFAGALLKKAPAGRIIPFNTEALVGEVFNRSDSIDTTRRHIERLVTGGTSLGAPVSHLLENKIKIDLFVGITDNEDWVPAERWQGVGHGFGHKGYGLFLDLWTKYRRKINPNAKAMLVTIQDYGHYNAPPEDDSVRYVYGWSANVVSLIPHLLESGDTIVDKVRNYAI